MDFLGEDEDLDIKTFESKIPNPDLHVQSAIKRDIRDLIISYMRDPSTPCPPHIKATAKTLLEIGVDPNILVIESERIYPLLWKTPVPDKILPGKLSSDSIFLNSLRVAKTITRANLSCLDQKLQIKDRDLQRHSDLLSIEVSAEVSHYNRVRCLWLTIRNGMYQKKRKRDQTFTQFSLSTRGYYDVLYNSEITIIIHDNLWYILDYHQVMMIHDTSTSRYLCYFVSELYQKTNYKHIPDRETLIELYKWGDEILEKKGNDGYQVIKNLEPVCTGVQLDKYDRLAISHQFYRELLSKAEEEGYGKEIRDLYNIISTHCENSPQIFEIFGCYRHFGHPTVNEEEGCKKMRDNTRKSLDIDHQIVNQVHGAWNRMFVLNFIHKNHRWPQCRTSLSQSSLLYRLISENITFIDEYATHITLEDWSTITYEKEFEFDFYPDFTQLLSDKALSPYLLNWARVYMRDLVDVKYQARMQESRRVLLEILKRPNIDLRAICDKIQSDRTPDSWKIIGLHSKERELKIAARMFAMMVIEMRLYFCATEANIAEKILPYIPCQTMTWDEITLMKHLHKITHSSRESRFIQVTISLDFEKWNNMWRHETTYPVFKSMDELLGVPGLISYTHKFFESSWFYLSSDLHPPDYLRRTTTNPKRSDRSGTKPKDSFQESNTTWAGQEGGCEGLRQKGWTSIQGAELMLAKIKTGIDGVITGQGDNQVLVIKVPIRAPHLSREDYLSQYQDVFEKDIRDYLKFLNEISFKTGKRIKLEETWVSERLFNYGKEILVDSIFLTSVFKKICRTYLSVTDTYPSLADRVASIHTATHAACLKNVDCVIPYMIACTEVNNMIQLEVLNPLSGNKDLWRLLDQEKVVIDHDLLLFINIFGKDFGGFPIMSFFDYIYRGHPDPVTSYLSWIHQISQEIPLAKKILEWIISLEGVRQKVDYLMIIQDPVSLNFERSVNGVNVIKNLLETKLSQVTKNRDLRLLLNSSSKSSCEKMVTYLSNTRPFSPRVLNTVYRNSPDGARMDFISTFIDMRTMKGILEPSEMNNLMNRLQVCDTEWLKFILQLYKRITKKTYIESYLRSIRYLRWSNIEFSQYCMTVLAQYLRNISWKIEVEHVTVPHPLEQFTTHCCTEGCSEGLSQEYITMIYCPPVKTLIEGRYEFSRGDITPYYGSSTKAKLSSRLVNLPRTDRSLRAAQSLYQTKSWVCNEDDGFSQFLTNLIKSRSPLSEETIAASSGVTCGGSVTHRFQDVVTKHSARPNTRTNLFTSIYISSDTAGKYSAGLEDYTMHFQGIFLAGLYCLQHEITNREKPLFRSVFHSHVACERCCKLIDEPPFFNDSPIPKIPVITGCKVLYSDIPDISTILNWKDIGCMNLVYPNLNDRLTSIRRPYCAAYMILGSASENRLPLVHSPQQDGFSQDVVSGIQIGCFLQIGVLPILKALAVLWFTENLIDIYSKVIQDASDIRIVMRSLLMKNPRQLWAGIRGLILHHKVLDLFLQEVGLLPGSSQAFRGSPSLDIMLSGITYDCCVDAIVDIDKIKIPIYTSAQGFPISRAIHIWINQLAFQGYRSNLMECIKVAKTLHSLYGFCVQNGEFKMELFYLKYDKLRTRFVHLPDCIKQSPLIVSGVGAEPWLKIQNADVYTPIRDKISIPKKLPEHLEIFWEEAESLKILSVNRISLTFNRTLFTPLRSGNPIKEDAFRITVPSPYLEHQIKLTGSFSSAHYKYLSIFRQFGITSVESAICIGEGDGGVSRLLLSTNPIKKIYFNTLLDLSTFPTHRAPNYIPPELLPLKEKTRVEGINHCITLGGDILDDNYFRVFKEMVSGKHIDVITSDIELGHKMSPEYARGIACRLHEISLVVRGHPLIIMKTYFTSPQRVEMLINILLCSGTTCHLVSPVISSLSAQEIFLVVKADNVKELHFDSSSYWIWNDTIQETLEIEQRLLIQGVEEGTLTSISPSHETFKLNVLFRSLGYPDSIGPALQQLTGDYLDQSLFMVNPLQALSQTMEALSSLARERLQVYGLLLGSKRVPSRVMARALNKSSEGKDIESLCEWILNLKLLIWLMKVNFVPAEVFHKGISLYSGDIFLFEYIPEKHSWSIKYGRPWYKIYGWRQEQLT